MNCQTVLVSIEIQKPSEQVWEVIADFNNMHTWAPSIEKTESISPVKRGVGAVRRNTATSQLQAKLTAGLHEILGALKTRVETGNRIRE
tara:strand:+ start:61313 stop:61579 length:267 start_codon:yes stop_codon:yes gene_type:complete